MSDFLTNLAARALASPSMRPRTRSRFEPAPDASPWIAPVHADAEIEPAAPTPGSTRRSIPPPSTTEPDRAVEIERTPAPRRRQRAQELESIATEPEARPHLTPAVPSTEDDASSAHAPHAQRAAIVTTNAEAPSIASHTIHTERVHEHTIKHHDTTVRVESREVSARSDEPRVDATPRHRHDEQPPRIEREIREPFTPIATQDSRSAIAPANTESSAASEPIIHVSIGRVEVRAVTPPAAPQRTRTHSAPMTIEDYAARRNAKGRP